MSTVGRWAFLAVAEQLRREDPDGFDLLADPRFQLRFTLSPGELVLFDDSRVLHV